MRILCPSCGGVGMIDVGPKECRSCKSVYPLDNFPVQRMNPDGRSAYCVFCEKESIAGTRRLGKPYDAVAERRANGR